MRYVCVFIMMFVLIFVALVAAAGLIEFGRWVMETFGSWGMIVMFAFVLATILTALAVLDDPDHVE